MSAAVATDPVPIDRLRTRIEKCPNPMVKAVLESVPRDASLPDRRAAALAALAVLEEQERAVVRGYSP